MEWRHFLPVIGHVLDIGVAVLMFTCVYWFCFRLAEAVSATVAATLICGCELNGSVGEIKSGIKRN
jgi:hypothetical protein